MPLQAQLFGPLHISDDNQPLALPPSRGARGLLAYLLLHLDQSKERTAIITDLWPNQDETRSRRALTRALGHIRRSFPSLIETTEEQILISAGSVKVDYQQFLELTEAAGTLANLTADHLNSVLELYQGELCDDVYDDWVLIPRERARETYLHTLETLVRAEKAAGRFDHSLSLAQRLAASVPLRESVHQEIMRL